MVDMAYALGAPAGGGQQGGIAAFLPLIIIFAIFYFLLILPQQRKMKKHREFLSALDKGKWSLPVVVFMARLPDSLKTLLPLKSPATSK